MGLEEFRANQNRTWRRKVFLSSLRIAYVTLVIEIIIYISYFYLDSFARNEIEYFLLRVLVPSSVNFLTILGYRHIEKNKKISDTAKNYSVTCMILIICGVIATVHSYYFILWVASGFALFCATLFNSKKLLRFMLVGSLIIVMISMTVAIGEGKFVYGMCVPYGIVTALLNFAEYLAANQIMNHHIAEQETIYNELVKQQQLIDKLDIEPMTGLFNKKAMVRDVDATVERIKNGKSEKSNFLLMFDLDHFKDINDKYGHLNGDKVLLKMATILKDRTGDKGKVYRYGGEEFVVLLNECEAEDAYSLAEQVRQVMYHTVFEFSKSKKITTSAGVYGYKGILTGKQWFEETDRNLYRAKEEGRNRVVTDKVYV